MTAEKVREVIGTYRQLVEEQGIEPREIMDRCPESTDEVLAHAGSMFDQMEEFLDEGRIGKAFRWLGFIQGAFWKSGIYTINDLRDHNRSE